MSGQDAPAGGGGGAGPPSGSPDCTALQVVRLLQAPVAATVSELDVGDICHVELRSGPPEVVVVTDELLREAGGILPTIALLDCLRRGVEFVAEIRSIHGGAVELHVRARDCGTLRRLMDVQLTAGCTVAKGNRLLVRLPAGPTEDLLLQDGDVIVGTVARDAAVVACLERGMSYCARVVSASHGGAKVVIGQA